MTDATSVAPPPFRQAHTRWIICLLLLAAATINYVDRQVIGILKPTLTTTFGWTDERIYSSIIFSFSLAYAIGFIFAGRFMDWIGPRRGFAISVGLWSLAACAHGAANLVPGLSVPMLYLNSMAGSAGFTLVSLTGAAAGFAVARFALGLGEAGAFPASIKTVAEWFPKKERALATGIFNAGTNVGAMVTPLVVPWILGHWGWQWAFIGTGALGFAWSAWWLYSYQPVDQHPRVSPAELAYIKSDPADPVVNVRWATLLGHRQTWAFAMGKLLTDPVWWLYLYWVPDFLTKNFGIKVTVSEMGPPLIVIYLVADFGSVGGGWLSSRLLKLGWTHNAARKTAMLTCALLVVPVMFASRAPNEWVAIAIIALAAAAHQGWSANLFTLTSDMFPKQAVGSVVGIGGTAGAIGGMFNALLVGALLQATGSYLLIFIIAGSMYLLALLIIHLLAPKLAAVQID
jgi:ACS family hexuronate transporter-like MFS transporter